MAMGMGTAWQLMKQWGSATSVGEGQLSEMQELKGPVPISCLLRLKDWPFCETGHFGVLGL